MAPTIIFIRHAEALHSKCFVKSPFSFSYTEFLTNHVQMSPISPSPQMWSSKPSSIKANKIPLQDYTTHDPPLTTHGLESECSSLSQHLQKHVPLIHQVELIVTSPLTRTLQTTQHTLGFLIQRGVKVIPLAELQETTTNPIDRGRPRAALEQAWPAYDWSCLDAVFPAKEGLYAFAAEALLARGAAVRKWLAGRPEKVVAVVSHAGFLRIGLGNCKYGNADFRIFDLVPEQDGIVADGRPALVEWEQTKASGGGMGKSETGFYGWEVHDFKYMPGNEEKTTEELEEMVTRTPVR